ncbi:hypothetical protein [Morganella morganii]|uniref:hypothetical protein n=1 Tax=Morganella morganii TaxID=582 RepID=UPI001C4899DD|nr:hypothetical protein [Morganella morganii]QXO73588.1 hypothetical protein JC793_03890 [Morganella morganii]
MTYEQRQAFLDHIRESKEIVDGWPAWKREDSDSVRNNHHEDSLCGSQLAEQHRAETEAAS